MSMPLKNRCDVIRFCFYASLKGFVENVDRSRQIGCIGVFLAIKSVIFNINKILKKVEWESTKLNLYFSLKAII